MLLHNHNRKKILSPRFSIFGWASRCRAAQIITVPTPMLLSRLITIHLNITNVCPKGPAGLELAYQPASRLLDMAVTLHTITISIP